MVFPLFLSDQQQEALKYEVVPPAVPSHLTRILRRKYPEDDASDGYGALYFDNKVVNAARTLCGLVPYVLRADYLGEHHPAEQIWHQGEMDACLRRLDADELAEFLGEALENRWLTLDEVNDTLLRGNLSFRFRSTMTLSGGLKYQVELLEAVDVQAEAVTGAHPNIRLLIDRMDKALEERDYSLALATSASVIETLAKDVVGKATVQDQPLGSFFSAYRKSSMLPGPVLDYVEAIYGRRNTEPLAGHGHLSPPTVDASDASLLAAMTKAFVTHEKRMLRQRHLDMSAVGGTL